MLVNTDHVPPRDILTAPPDLRPAVVWFTGLSGAGKSTLADALGHALRAGGHRVLHLDGDAIRARRPATGWSRAARDAHARRVARLASRLERQGQFVLVALISPYRASREFARSVCRRFVEVHVATPLAECERRDVKGLYARVRRGELTGFTGVDDPYEPPERPELALDTQHVDVIEAVRRLLERLAR